MGILRSSDQLRVLGSQSEPPRFLRENQIIETFERENALTDYEGDTGSYAIDTTGAFDGNNYLATTDSGFSRIRRTDTTDTPEAGDTFAFQIRIDGSTNHRLRFGVQDRDNNYGVLVDRGLNDKISIYERDDGSFAEYTSASITPPTNEWLRGVVDWATDGTITFTLFEATDSQLAQVSATDTQYTDGSIGFSHNADGDDRIDFLRYV